MIPIPCPGCANLPIVEQKKVLELWRVRCSNEACPNGPLTVWQVSRAHAIAAWNGTDDIPTQR